MVSACPFGLEKGQCLFMVVAMESAEQGGEAMVKGKLDKTYHCDICGQEVKVTKEGVGVLVCCNKPMREM